jgi:DNA polymerase I
MEFELQPGINIQLGTFSAVIAPDDLVLSVLNGNEAFQRFMFLFVSGNYSRLLPRINRRSTHLDLQRAFTSHQLLNILHGAYHTIVFVEHDETLYDGAEETLDPVSSAMRDLARNALLILYAPRRDSTFDVLSKRADRFFFFGVASRDKYASRGQVDQMKRISVPASLRTGQTMLEDV